MSKTYFDMGENIQGYKVLEFPTPSISQELQDLQKTYDKLLNEIYDNTTLSMGAQ